MTSCQVTKPCPLLFGIILTNPLSFFLGNLEEKNNKQNGVDDRRIRSTDPELACAARARNVNKRVSTRVI